MIYFTKKILSLITTLLKGARSCFIILFSILVRFLDLVSFDDKKLKFRLNFLPSTIKIYKKVVSSSDESIPDYLFGREIDDPRIGEIQKKIHFRLFIPEYIPEDYRLNKIDILNNYEEKETVTFLYISSNDKKNCFEIAQRNFLAESNVALNITKDENTKIEY